MERFLLTFTALWRRLGLPWRMIDRPDEGDYLERYYGLRTRWGGAYLHRFWRSDADGLHDHPWPFMSIPLTLPFIEHTLQGSKIRLPWRPYFRGTESFHRIQLMEGDGAGRTWTLFIHGPILKKWGFIDDATRYEPWTGPESIDYPKPASA